MQGVFGQKRDGRRVQDFILFDQLYPIADFSAVAGTYPADAILQEAVQDVIPAQDGVSHEPPQEILQ